MIDMSDDLSNKLFDKISAEKRQYRDWLMRQEPAVILNHAYKYSMYEDILYALAGCQLSENQCKALLNSPNALEEIYKDLDKQDDSYRTENIIDTIEQRANTNIRRELRRIQQNER